MTDPIADMITQIRNAQMVLKETIEFPYSKIRHDIGKILEREKFIGGIQMHGRPSWKFLELRLQFENKKPVISGVRKISKAGQRIFRPFSRVRKIKGGS